MKIKIQTRKLASGKCQVKFEAKSFDNQQYYGYLLTDANDALRDVMHKLEQQLACLDDKELLYHAHLYNLDKRPSQRKQDFWIFQN